MNGNRKRIALDSGASSKRSRRPTETVGIELEASTRSSNSNRDGSAQRPTQRAQHVEGSSVASVSNAIDSTQVQHLAHEREMRSQHLAPSYVSTESSSTRSGGHTRPSDVTLGINTPSDTWTECPNAMNQRSSLPGTFSSLRIFDNKVTKKD